jgi:oxygen-independent coproporphyrinogen-3 oxidase
VRDRIDQDRFGAALRRELAHEANRLGRRRLTSVFFGGGTPSLMRPATVAALLDDAARLFGLDPAIEITLEANPTSVEAARLADFRSAGVNRISVGIQSLDPAALRMLGREHTAAEAVAALGLARRLFHRISFDLIYARPDQSPQAWQAELRDALAIAADHLSLYQLTIETGTKFEALHRQGQVVLPDDTLAAELYGATEETCAAAGLLGYEISNYAVPGGESRHNLAYWRYQDYAGIGPGAHGRTTLDGTLRATRRHRAPEVWAERVERDGHALTTDEQVRPEEMAREALLMGLRLTEGIDRAHFRARTGRSIAESVDVGMLQAATEAGYITQTADRLIATAEGRLRLDALLAALVL